MDYPKSVPNVGLVNGKFVDENTSTGQVGSLIPAGWGSAITDEILAVITAAGLVPNEAILNQLNAAINIKISNAATVFASQAEAEAGAVTTKAMSPLRVFQAIAKVVTPATESNKGTSRFGTPAEQVAGLLTTAMSNPAGVLALLTAWFPRRTFAYRDYIRIPDVPGGLIVQWGRDSNATAGPITVFLPTAFPSAKWLELATPVLGSPAGWDTAQSAGSTSLSQSVFNRRSGNGTSTNVLSNFDVFWLSLGF